MEIRRLSLSLIWSLFILSMLHANISAPTMPNSLMGQLFTLEDLTDASGNPIVEALPLGVEREELSFDIYLDRATGRARYVIINASDTPIETPLFFSSRETQVFMVSVNSTDMELYRGDGENPPELASRIPGLPSGIEYFSGDIRFAVEQDLETRILSSLPLATGFLAALQPGTNEIIVEFEMDPGWAKSYPNVVLNPSMGQTARSLNVTTKNFERLDLYIYDLFPAESFGDGFGELEITVRVHQRQEFYSPNLQDSLVSVSPDDPDVQVYHFRYDGLPGPYFEFATLDRMEYNILGFDLVPLGLSMVVPSDGKAVNFQYSARADLALVLGYSNLHFGLEAVPWGARPLMAYTTLHIHPDESAAYGYGGFLDYRYGGGLVFDLEEEPGLGVRLLAGVKIGINFHLEYDWIFNGNNPRHRVTFNLGMGF